jgi:hypothetical protein
VVGGDAPSVRVLAPLALPRLPPLPFASALAAALVVAPFGHAGAENHVRVKGTTRIDAHAARSAGRLVVSGTVIDDTARPVPGAHVLLTFTRAASTVPLLGASADACSEGGARPVLERADALTLPTDEAARFCVRLTLAVDRYEARLESRAPGLYDDARLELAVDLALAPLTLRFDPERSILSLDDDKTALEVIASTEDDGVTAAAVSIPLTLSNESGAVIGTALTNASGRARFAVDSVRLGPPGRGELRVAFAGGPDSGPSTHTVQVERRTRVDLSVPEAHEERLPAGVPEEGVKVRVLGVSRCASRGCPEVATGTIEARVGDAIVGAASLEGGEAHVVATFPSPAGSDVPLRLRYIPDAPWLQPGGDLAVTLPLKPPAPWKKVPLALAAMAAIAWLVLARLPSRAPAVRPSKRPPAPPEAGIHVLRQAPAGHGWGGTLHDAHEGFAIAGGRVAVERPGFERVAVMAQALTDTAGSFVLPPIEVLPGDVLAAEGPFHAALRRPLPPSGELDVALVLRRRALLDRLVAWARRRGRPFDAKPEPTPGHVRRAGAAELPIARWADAVERAAYGGAAVDARVQADVERLEPPDRPESADPPAEDVRPRRGPPGPR